MKSLIPKIHFSVWDNIAILICSIPAFYLLGTPAIYIWDEAVYANASLDMSQGHHWWIPAQDLYNTKPPLVLWMQALFLKFIPWPEWAVRLPSALSVTGIMIMLTFALKRWAFSQWTRILVLICFVCNEGFIRHHIARTGDLDAVMSIFVTGYILIVLDGLHFRRWTFRHALFFFLMAILAFYAKSIAGWIMLGPLGILWLMSPLRKIVWSKTFVIGSIISLLICSLYYFTRESIQPGYFSLTWKSEYLRMFSNVMPWHEHGVGYYFKNFVALHTYTPWIFFMTASILYSLFFLKNKITQQHLIHWIIISLGYLLIISIPADKLEWYDAPVYPFFALILGVTLGHFTSYLPKRWQMMWVIPIAFIFWRKLNFISLDIHIRDPLEREGSILRHVQVDDKTRVFMKVNVPEHQLQLDFYRKLNGRTDKTGKRENGDIRDYVEVMNSLDQITVGDEIIISQEENLKSIQDKFLIDTLKSWPELGYEISVKSEGSTPLTNPE